MWLPSKMVPTVTVNGLRHARQFSTPSRSRCSVSSPDFIRLASPTVPQCGQAGFPSGQRRRSSIRRASASDRRPKVESEISEGSSFMDARIAARGCYVKCIIPSLEFVPVSRESRALRDAYLAAEVVGRNSDRDAHHVALATLARADMI